MSRTGTIIFDFDGTLADTFSMSVRISNTLAPLFGYRIVSDEDVPALRNLSLPELFRRLEVPMHRLPRLFSRARREVAVEMPSIRLFDGIAELLDELLNRGHRLGVVTSNSAQNVSACLAHNGVAEKFMFIHSAHNLFGKHRVLTRLMNRWTLLRDRVLYVGDEIRDIEASKKCGIPIAAVSWGFQTTDRLVSMNPDFVAERPADVVSIVDSLFGRS